MQNELSNHYFRLALESAKAANLTRACEYAAISIGVNPENEDCRKLAGLCYYKLGNYAMAKYCFQNSVYYLEEVKDVISEKQDRLADIRQCVDRKQYKKAIQILEKLEDKSVSEYHYLGCLYAALRKKDKALSSFQEALKEDSTNEKVLYYLRNISHGREKRWWKL